MARFTKHLLPALKKEFPFLADWQPWQFHDPARPVEFTVARVLNPDIVWPLEYGRLNNGTDTSYTNGVTAVAISDGKRLEWFSLNEGETRPEDILKSDTRFVLVQNEYRSQLTQDDPGWVEITLYKRGEQTVAEIKEDAAKTAANMRAQLEA